MRIFSLTLLSVPLFLFALSAPGASRAEGGISVSGAWVRALPPGADATAAYMTIENAAGVDDALVEVGCGCSRGVSIHSTVREEGSDLVGMKELSSLGIPSGRSVALEPGGLHLMLEGARSPLGEEAVLVLRFEKGGEVTVRAPVVRSAAGDGHRHHGR